MREYNLFVASVISPFPATLRLYHAENQVFMHLREDSVVLDMRYLIICYSFPGAMSSIAKWLSQQPGNEVVLASSWNRHGNEDSNIRMVTLKKGEARPLNETGLDCWTEAVKNGKRAVLSLLHISKSGFVPDIILVSTGNGSALDLRDIFPLAFIVNYLEPRLFPNAHEARIWKNLQLVQSLQSDMIFTFDRSSSDDLGDLIKKPIANVPICIDTDYFAPDKDRIRDSIVVNFRNFEEGKIRRWLDRMMKDIKMCAAWQKIAILSSITLKRKLSSWLTKTQEDMRTSINVEFITSSDMNRKLFSSALLYISPNNGIQSETMEAMSCATPVMTHTDGKILKHGTNFLDIKKCDSVTLLLNDIAKLREIGMNARKSALDYFDFKKIIPDHVGLIMDSYKYRNQTT